MLDSLTQQLAEHAGLNLHWHNYTGAPQTVALPVLRRILAALELPADSQAQARDSLARQQQECEQITPKLLTGRAGAPIRLPATVAARINGRLRLRSEDGGFHQLGCRADDGGAVADAFDQPGYHTLLLDDGELTLALAPATHAHGPRQWALAAQLYGLRRPGDGGVGDYSALAELAQAAALAGADALAISPVHALFSADSAHFSPYSPSSRLFLNVLHIDPAQAGGHVWLQQRIAALGLEPALRQLEARPLVDWSAAARIKLRLLRDAWDHLDRWPRGPALREELERFCVEGGEALADHARFEAIHAAQFGADPTRWHWRDWPPQLRDPRSEAVAAFARANEREVGFHCFLQWLAARGLGGAQAAALGAGMGTGLIADLAVGTSSGGSHAWSLQHDLLLGVAVGAPPDLINAHGQDWGLTTFSPRALIQHGFAPFIALLRAALRYAGGVRIDHVLGLRRLWLVPEGCAADEGAYLDYPFADLLNLIALECHRHQAHFIGEDLGTVPAGFRDRLADAGGLGMQVLWFERDHGLFVDPSRWSPQAIATTTTHDLPTVAGWWRERDLDWRGQLGLLPSDSDEATERAARATDRTTLWAAFTHAGVATGPPPPPEQPQAAVDAAIDFVARTPAPLAVVPLEDLLGYSEQPNLPGTIEQHPNWRRRLPLPASTLLRRPAAQARLETLQRQRGRSGSDGDG